MMAAAAMARARILEGCKEIAAALADEWGRDISEHQAWRYVHHSDQPLPAWISRGRIFAHDSTVRAWARRQARYRRAPNT
jgi:hypothetical protein